MYVLLKFVGSVMKRMKTNPSNKMTKHGFREFHSCDDHMTLHSQDEESLNDKL